MRIRTFAAAAMLGFSALGLSGCATGFPAQVSRHQAMPAPQGQTFFVVPADQPMEGTFEFQRFGGLVGQRQRRRVGLAADREVAGVDLQDRGAGFARDVFHRRQQPLHRGRVQAAVPAPGGLAGASNQRAGGTTFASSGSPK